MQLVARIYQTLEEQHFCLYTQTIVSLDSRHHQHYKLLLRIKDEKAMAIPSDAFLPATERYNLAGKLDRWVVENTFSLMATHPVFVSQIQF